MSLSSDEGLPDGYVTLVTIRGLPEALSLNTGSKLENGDWLLLKDDILQEDGSPSDLKIMAQDLNYSGNFSLSAWSVTSVPLTGQSSVSKPVYFVGTINPIANDPNLVVQSNVSGEEDDPEIPLTIRYELIDSSETIQINLKIHQDDVISETTGGTPLKFIYKEEVNGEIVDQEIDVVQSLTPDDAGFYTISFDDIDPSNDLKITSLKIIPAKDYFSTEADPLNLTVSAIVTDGVDQKTFEKQIDVIVEERADPIEVEFESFQTDTPDDLTDISKVINSNDVDLSNFEINTYEEIASNKGITILNTDGNGNYDILNKFVDSTDLKNTDIQTLRFEVSGVAPNSSESSLINQFVFEVSDTNSEPSEVLETKSIVPKIEEIEYNGSVTQTFIFSIPSLSNNQTLKLLTPDNYDDEVSFDVYTVVSANGDTAISQTPLSLKVTVFSDGSPAEVSTSESIAIEDGMRSDYLLL